MKSVLGCLFFRKIPVLVAYKEVAYKQNRVLHSGYLCQGKCSRELDATV